MFGRGWRIGSIAGIPIKLDGSWVWIAVLYTYSQYLSVQRDGLVASQGEAIALAVLSAALFFGSVLVHELGHAATARALGLPVTSVTLVFWGGFTETRAEKRGALGEFLVSAAGPVSTLLLGGVFWLLTSVTVDSAPAIAEMFRYLAFLNLLLAALNALPGFPLDGGRVLLAIAWKVTGNRAKGTRVAAAIGIFVAASIAVVGIMAITRRDLAGLYALFIAYMIYSGARSAGARVETERELADGIVRDAMSPPPDSIPADLSLSEALDRYLRNNEDEVYPVLEGDRLVGVISLRSARRVGGRDPLRPVRDGMVPIEDVSTVPAGESLDEALGSLGRSGTAFVVDDGALVGRIGADDIEVWLGSRRAERLPTPPRPDR